MIEDCRRWWGRFKRIFLPYTSQIKFLIDQAVTDKQLDLGTAGLMKASMSLRDLRVVDVMTPKSQIIQVRMNDSIDTILEKMKDSSHSRYPVFEEDGLYPQGILFVKDFITHSVYQDTFSLKDIIRQPLFTPFSRRLHDLLNDFRKNRMHMALATDEHGLCIGLITIEDVLEQIVGEIEDEHDPIEIDRVISHPDLKTYSIQADYSLDDFMERFDYTVDENFDTLGGFVTHLFGYLPRSGEAKMHQGISFRVLQANSRQLLVLEVRDDR
jgi:magnesium and cobalt transporter